MTAALSPADVLRQAADHLAIPGNWGRDYFISPVDKCRCAAGAVAWVLAPNDTEGNPTSLASRDKTDLGRHATAILADYLIDHENADLGEQAVETIAFWNDDQETAEPVVMIMRATADEWDARKVGRTAVNTRPDILGNEMSNPLDERYDPSPEPITRKVS